MLPLMPVSSTDDAWPLTGRDDELRAVTTALDSADGIVLAGAAGVGKSRLVREAVAAHAGEVRWVLATESARPTPLGAFAALLGSLGEGITLAAAHAALGKGPSALAVDDAHLLDDVSATLLHQLAADGRVRMAVTIRSGEPTPDAVTALWKDGLLTRLEVRALSEDQVTALLENGLGGQLEGASARRLFAATAGNALWLRHLVDGERAAGRLVSTAGMWHWGGEPRLGPALTALVDQQIGELTREVRLVLELLALAEPLVVELLEALAGAAEVEEAAERGLITATRAGGRWEARLAHPLYGEAVRARLNPVRARRLRGRLVEALTGADGDDPLRLAVLAVDSDLPSDPDLLGLAAHRATVLTDTTLAIRLATAARDGGGGFDAQLMLAYLLIFEQRAEEAETELALAAALADTDALRLDVAHGRAFNLYMMLARTDDAYAVLDAAGRECSGIEAEMLGIRALFAACLGRLDDGAALAQRALAEPGQSQPCEMYAAWAASGVAALTGRCEGLQASATRASAAAARSPLTAAMMINPILWEVLGLGLAGLVDAAQDTVDRLAASLTGSFVAIFRAMFDGWMALVTGRADAAVRLLREFRPYYPGHGGGITALFELLLAVAHGMAGDAAGVREALGRAEAGRHGGVTFVDPLFPLATAWLAAAEGTTSAAVTQARRSAAQAGRSGQLAVEVLARHTAVCFGDRGQATRLAELSHRVDGPRAPAAAAHAAALAAGDPIALLAASAQFAAAGLMLPAAEAAAQAVPMHRKRGDLPAAAAATARVEELVTACDGARTPALLAAAQPLPITDRQREIAALVAAGLSNREIADRLGVSVRTVEGHIYTACATLDLPGRAALAALHSAWTDP